MSRGLARPHLAEGGAEADLRSAIDDLANQLCLAVDGNFDFAVRSPVADETLEKLSMLINFVLDTARRGMGALREHNAALAQLDQAKTVFFSNASHELRTPLTLILGPLEDALAQSPPALSPDALAAAHRNALRLLKLVNALLDFSRLEAGRMQGTFHPTDLAALTTELAGVFRGAIEGAGLQLSVDCPPLPQPAYVDPAMWEKIVLNLLSNAFKFTFQGRIEVSLRAQAGSAVLTISDTGIGIEAGELPHIFERFRRVEGVRARTHEGFGIGLAMIQELAQLHGGAVTAESAAGAGSTFRVTIPLGGAHLPADRVAAADAAVAPVSSARAYVLEAQSWLSAPQAAAAARKAPSAEEPAHVLLVDDNSDMRAYVARLLAAHWTVSEAADGAQALALMRQRRPDLVISDVMMPRMDGHELVRRVRADPLTEGVPVVLLTARAGDEAVIEGLEAGADEYLVKPFSGRELVARARTLLRLSRARSDATAIERLAALMNSKLELRELVQVLTDEATRLCGAQFGAFFYNQVDAKGELYMLYTLAGVPREAFANFPMPRNTALFAPTFNGERTVRLDDVTRDPRYGRSAPHHGMPPGHLPVRSYLAVPVVARSGEVLGGLFFGHREPAMFTERAERVLAAVAHHAAVALQNAHLYGSEQKARAEAEAAMRAKDEFLAMLGHELRNPLAPMVTALEIMGLRGEAPAEVGMIQRQVRHMVRLVDDLLDVSRIARGKIELCREPLEVAALVRKAVEMSSPLLEARRHTLALDLGAGLHVHGDRLRLEQVLCNLINNAAKFTHPGGRIEVSTAADGEAALLQVRDNGIGIEPSQLTRIFDMFAQGEQALDRSPGGLGLGLAIARNLLQLHGGTIEARSDGPGTGAMFVVRLPLYRGAPEPERAAATADGRGAVQALRILVVDDNQDAAEALACLVQLLGHRVEVRHDGPAAVQAAAQTPPDIVLLDIGLPGMDGFQVASELRRLPGMSAARIVALSGYGGETHRERGSAAGFDRHLVKPVDLAALQALLDKDAP